MYVGVIPNFALINALMIVVCHQMMKNALRFNEYGMMQQGISLSLWVGKILFTCCVILMNMYAYHAGKCSYDNFMSRFQLMYMGKSSFSLSKQSYIQGYLVPNHV